jgi:hypothetical protein
MIFPRFILDQKITFAFFIGRKIKVAAGDPALDLIRGHFGSLTLNSTVVGAHAEEIDESSALGLAASDEVPGRIRIHCLSPHDSAVYASDLSGKSEQAPTGTISFDKHADLAKRITAKYSHPGTRLAVPA